MKFVKIVVNNYTFPKINLRMEQEGWRAIIFHFAKKGLNASQIKKELVAVHRDEAPAYSTVTKWAAHWRNGVTSIFDAPRSGRPCDAVTSQTVLRVRKIINNDRRLTLEQVSNMTKISKGSVYTIVNKELGLSKLSARWVPKMLTKEMMCSRLEISEQNLQEMRKNKSKFFDRIVTQDETWVHHFDPESKEQSKEWKEKGSPAPRKFKKVRRCGKVMASIFWDVKGILMIDYLEKGKTINGKYYADLLVKLREAIKEKRRGKLSKTPLLLQDNASVHTAQIAVASAHNCGFQLLDHPAYSPDLAPSDFYLFPTIKRELRGKIFDSDDEVIDAVEDILGEKDEEFFKNGIYKLEDRWTRCVEKDGDYVEK